MGRSTRCLWTLAASTTLWAVGGCGGAEKAGGGAAAAPKVEATVSGTVTVKGKAASKGRLTFEPLGANGIPTGSHVAQVSKDGAYTVTTATGSNDVTISGTGDAAVDSSYNKMTFEVKPGSNALNVDLPLKP